MGRKVIFYRTETGKCFIEDFLESLPGKTAQKVTWVLSLLEEFDILPSNYFKKLTGSDEIWECRIKLGSNIYRVFCFFFKSRVVILTHGIQKKTQKTPKGEIKKAEKYRQDYLSRRKK